MRNKLPKIPRWLSLTAIGLFLLYALGEWLVGNVADAIADFAASLIGSSGWEGLLRWCLVAAAIVAALAIGHWWGRSSSDQSDDLRRAEERNEILRLSNGYLARLAALDDSLLNLLPELAMPENQPTGIERLLTETIADCCVLFRNRTHRGLVLRRMEDELVPWASHEVSGPTVARTRFFVGDDRSPLKPDDHGQPPRGIAGKAFINRTLYVVRFDYDEIHKRWVPDDPDYFAFDSRRKTMPYRSCVSVPIVWSDRGECLGVLCLDSNEREFFDPPDVQDYLRVLARRFAVAILLQQRLASSSARQDLNN